MILSFKCKETEKLFFRERSRKFPPSIHRAALRKLHMLDAAHTLDDLRIPPANHLERLKGARAGQFSIRINERWRLCFEWKRQNAFNVEIVDYH